MNILINYVKNIILTNYMKKDLNEFSLELLWLFLKEKLYKIVLIVLILYVPSAIIIYKNSPENWNVEAIIIENSNT